MVRGSNPGGVRFSARPDRPWGPPSLLYNGYRVFPGGKYGRSVLLTLQPLLVSWSWKSRAITLPNFWATTGSVTGTLYLSYITREKLRRLSRCSDLLTAWLIAKSGFDSWYGKYVSLFENVHTHSVNIASQYSRGSMAWSLKMCGPTRPAPIHIHGAVHNKA